jgi:putative membrane protein
MGFAVEASYFLPPIYATINGITAVLLVSAVMAIKKESKITKELMKGAIGCSILF